MQILAADVGYGNLKGAFGSDQDREPRTFVRPAGAAPVDALPTRIGGAGTDDYALVQIGGETWAAGVEASQLQNWERDLHEDYPATASYMALYLAALLYAETDHIDAVITGLPVSQAKDPAYRKTLADRLTGTFNITAKRTVTVGQVTVIPQPVGAYLDMMHRATGPDLDFISDARVLVIDPGFGSVDWILLDPGGQLRSHSAGTSPHAMSFLLEEAGVLVGKEHGRVVGRERLDEALRRRQRSILVGGERIDLEPFIREAAQKTARHSLTKLRQTLRTEDRQPDIVLLTGGGAETFAEAAREVYPQARVEVPPEPVLANVRGFWYCR